MFENEIRVYLLHRQQECISKVVCAITACLDHRPIMDKGDVIEGHVTRGGRLQFRIPIDNWELTDQEVEWLISYFPSVHDNIHVYTGSRDRLVIELEDKNAAPLVPHREEEDDEYM